MIHFHPQTLCKEADESIIVLVNKYIDTLNTTNDLNMLFKGLKKIEDTYEESDFSKETIDSIVEVLDTYFTYTDLEINQAYTKAFFEE